MKRMILAIITILSFFFINDSISAEEYICKDLRISLNNNIWDVYEREKVINNSNYYGFSSEEAKIIKNDFINRDVYLDAVNKVLDEAILITVKKWKNLDDEAYKKNETIEDIKNEYREDKNVLEVYDKNINGYKYIVYKYKFPENYCKVYFTVVNGNRYTISFNKSSQINNADSIKYEKIIESVSFDDKNSEQDIEKEKNKSREKSSFDTKKFLLDTLTNTIIISIVSVVTLKYKNKKSKKSSLSKTRKQKKIVDKKKSKKRITNK